MRHVFSIILLLFSLSCNAQDWLSGVVVNKETGDTLRDAVLQYKRFGIIATPDSMDHFRIVKLADYLTVYAAGFQTLRFLVGANTPNHLCISLRPEEQLEQDSLVLAEIRRINEKGKGRNWFRFDPLRTMVSRNSVDGFRTRIGGQTTARLSPRWFFSGSTARGWKSKENYYSGAVSYSFNDRENLLSDFPQRSLTLSTSYDLTTPSSRYSKQEADNLFSSLRWARDERLMFFRRHQLAFRYDTSRCLSAALGLKMERNSWHEDFLLGGSGLAGRDGRPLEAFRTTELNASLTYSPHWTFSIAHAVGISGLLGGEHDYNYTELSAANAFSLREAGRLSVLFKGGTQWNKVMPLLLVMPQANTSFFLRENTFSLVNEMEFVCDRFLSAQLEWNLQGFFLDRLLLNDVLKAQEVFGLKTFWGGLSERNRQPLPDGCFILDGRKPYLEFFIGLGSIFKCIDVQYVGRLNYLGHPDSRRHGVRFNLKVSL